MDKLRLQWSERWSDEGVCRVYGLTYDEVKVIEPDFPLSEAEYEGSDNA